jgi:hypothetical protein
MKCTYHRICKGKRKYCPGSKVRGQWEHCALKAEVDDYIEKKLVVLQGMEKESGAYRAYQRSMERE